MSVTPIDSWIRPQDETFSLVEGKTRIITTAHLLGGDVGLNGSILSIKSVEQPDHGTLTLQADGSYLYTPEPGYVGLTTIKYTVTDQFGNTCTEHMLGTITKFVPNQAPTVVDEFVEVTAGVAVSAPESLLIANDKDTDGGTLSVGNYGKPAHGTLCRTADGTLTYTADAGYSGADSFTYEVSDGQGGVTVGTVHLNVLPAENKAPVVQGEFASVRGGTSVSAPESLLLANDMDPEGGALTVKSLSQPANGTLVRAADGMLTYTPKAGFVGTDTFTYVVADAQGKESVATVTLNVTPALKTPVVSGVEDNVGPKQGLIPAGGTTDDSTPTFKGTAEAGATVELYDGLTKIGQTTADASGNWTLTPATPLSNGAHSLAVRTTATDGAVADSAPFGITLAPDAAQPAPVVRLADDLNGDGFINKDEASGRVDVVVELTAGTKVGDSIALVDQDGNLTGKKVDAADLAAGKVVFKDAFALPADGKKLTVTAQITPAGGAPSDAGSITATVDTTAVGKPTLTLVSDTNGDGRLSRAELDNAGGLDLKIALAPDAQVGDRLVLVDQDGRRIERVLSAADVAAKSVSLDNAFPTPADGKPVVLTATLLDPAGNVSLAATVNAAVNTTAPTVSISLVDDQDNDGTLTRNELAGSTRVDIRVDLPQGMRAGDQIEVRDNAGHGVSKAVSAEDIAAGEIQFLDAFPLPAAGAVLAVTAKVTDIAGNVSVLATDKVTFDGNYAPVGADDSVTVRGFATPMLSIVGMNHDTGKVVAGGQTWVTADGDAGRAVYGQLSSLMTAGMKVQVASSDNPGAWLDAVISSDGLHWTAVDTTAHTSSWSYTARLVDVSGQTLSTSMVQAVTLDAQAVATPVIDSFGTQVGDTSIKLNSATTDQTLVVNGHSSGGAASAGKTVELYANGSGNLLGTAVVKADGSWSVDLSNKALANGGSPYNFYAREVDDAGRSSAWSNKAALTVNTADSQPENWANFGAPIGHGGAGSALSGSIQTSTGLVKVNVTTNSGQLGTIDFNASIGSGLQNLFPGGAANGSEGTVLTRYPDYLMTLNFDKVLKNPNLLLASVYGDVTITATDASGKSFNPVLRFVDNTPGSSTALTGISGNTVQGAGNAQGVVELSGDITSITISGSNAGNWSYVQLAQQTMSGGLVLGQDDGSIVPGAGAVDVSGDAVLSFSSQATLDAALITGVDAGAGLDTLRLAGDGLRLDLTAHTSTPAQAQDLAGVEQFDLVAGSGRSALVMSVNDVLALGRSNAFVANGKTQILVKGDASDSLSLTQLVDNGGDTGNWAAAGTVLVDGVTYNAFNHSSLNAQVLAQQGLKVQVPSDPGVPATTTTYPQSTGNVLGNDTDPDGNPADLRIGGAGKQPNVANGANVGIPIEGQYGHLTLKADGSYTYVADKSAGITAGQTDVFYYLPKDANGANASTPSQLTFKVEPPFASISSVSSPKDGVSEGGVAEFTVATTVSPISTPVTLELLGGTATPGTDTTGPLQVNFGKGWVDVVGGVANVPAGSSSFQVRVTVADDKAIEPNETLRLKVSSASGSSTSAELTLLDNDFLSSSAKGSEDTPLTLTWSDFNLNDLAGALPKLMITALPADGKLEINKAGTWQAVTLNQEVSKADIDAGKLRFTPDANESGGDVYKTAGVGNMKSDYAQVQFTAYDDKGNAFSGGKMSIDIAAVADANTATVTAVPGGHIYSYNYSAYTPWPIDKFGAPQAGETFLDKVNFTINGNATDTDGSEVHRVAMTGLTAQGVIERVFNEDGSRVLPDANGVVWVDPAKTYYVSVPFCDLEFDYVLYRQEVTASGEVLSQSAPSASQHLSYRSPLVLDLDGNGVQTTDAANGAYFDLDADGKATRTGWTDGKDGFLVMDRNGNGRIDNGSELFGDATPVPGGQAQDGFEALAALDSNSDGQVNAADAGFANLQVWVDENQDGVSQATELHSLGEVGVVSLNLAAQASSQVQNGNLIALVSSYTGADGATHELADVWFSGTGEQAPELAAADLLQAAGDLESLLPVAAAEPSADAAASATATELSVDLGSLRWHTSPHSDLLTEQFNA